LHTGQREAAPADFFGEPSLKEDGEKSHWIDQQEGAKTFKSRKQAWLDDDPKQE
jgi:hypothetical protein